MGKEIQAQLKKELEIFAPIWDETVKLPVLTSTVQGGFPSPADDYIEKRLDLNELVVRHPTATFYVRVEGNSMTGAGINSGDILVVDRSVASTSGKIVIAILNGEFTVKRIVIDGKRIFLKPENPQYPTIEVAQESDFQVWGVVTYVIHKTS